MSIILYGIKNYDTVKKARRWLETQQIEYIFHDFRVDGLTEDMLKDFLKHVDWETLLKNAEPPGTDSPKIRNRALANKKR